VGRLSKICGIGICIGASAGGADKSGPTFIAAGYGGSSCAESGDGEQTMASATTIITASQRRRAFRFI
jgi:hypothetical protein